MLLQALFAVEGWVPMKQTVVFCQSQQQSDLQYHTICFLWSMTHYFWSAASSLSAFSFACLTDKGQDLKHLSGHNNSTCNLTGSVLHLNKLYKIILVLFYAGDVGLLSLNIQYIHTQRWLSTGSLINLLYIYKLRKNTWLSAYSCLLSSRLGCDPTIFLSNSSSTNCTIVLPSFIFIILVRILSHPHDKKGKKTTKNDFYSEF